MTTDNSTESTDDESPSEYPDAADFRVELRDRPVLVRPDIEVELGVALRNVDISVVRDGILNFRADTYRPIDHVDRRVREAVENEGYAIERYADVAFSLPKPDSRLTTVEFTLKVTGDGGAPADD